MFLTEQEIFDQPNALVKTLAYMETRKDELRHFFKAHAQRKFVFLGCGSSYMLSKSAQRMFAACPDTTAYAIAGGDYLVNPDYYANTVRDAIVVTLSRSGRTSEIVRAVKHIKETLGCQVISVSMKDDNDIMPMSDFDLTLDWCYDNSVCQTRTVTNLYAATLLLAAYYSDDERLHDAVAQAVHADAKFISGSRAALKAVAKLDWNNVVVLADGAVGGIAEEGALAFTEIAMLHGRYFNMLDYRHGPIVLNDKKTLTIALLQPVSPEMQCAMIDDLKAHGGVVVTVGAQPGNPCGAAAHITLPSIDRFEAWGIPFIFVTQMIAYAKALEMGNNPDQPAGLDAFIVLK